MDSLFCHIDLSTSIARSWLLGYSSSSFFFFPKIVFVLIEPVPFCVNFRIKFSLFTKNIVGILLGITLDLYLSLG